MSGLLKWSIVFFIVSLIAAVFGFSGIATGAADAARLLFFAFLCIAIVLLVLGTVIFKSIT